MGRAVLTTILLLAQGSVGQARDFTGFYAGLNAGYARTHDGDRTTGRPTGMAGTAPGRPGADQDLPPSVRDAAAAIRSPAWRATPAAPGH